MPQPLDRKSPMTCALLLVWAGCTGQIASPSLEQDRAPALGETGAQGPATAGGAPGADYDPAGTNPDAPNLDGTPADPRAPGAQGPAAGPDATPDPGDGEDPEPAEPQAPVPASGLALREVAIYQGVKIAIAQGASDVVTRNANVVSGRPGLLRVFVDPDASFTARTIVAHLTLSNPGAVPEELDATLNVSAASRDEALTSTFNFELAGELLRKDTEFAVELREVTGAASSANSNVGPTRTPETGVAPLGARSAGSPFRVVVVPVRYQADGSSRTPDVGPAALQELRDRLFGMFPTSNVEVSARAPMDFAGAVQANGSGWSELLDQCLSQRNADGADARTYYYCMFDPASDFGNYCRGGCVAGLGPVPGARDTFARAAIGLGFGDAAGTMAHELGHTLGRPHAPCGGVAGPDPGYPHAGGRIGSWGYDLTTKQLLSPSDHTDLMGYCDNAWISDYNYELIRERFEAVLTAPALRPEPRELLSIVIDADQSLRLGHAVTLTAAPQGEPIAVRFVDAAGALLEGATGTFVAVSHLSGGLVYVSTPPAGTAAIELADFGTLPLN